MSKMDFRNWGQNRKAVKSKRDRRSHYKSKTEWSTQFQDIYCNSFWQNWEKSWENVKKRISETPVRIEKQLKVTDSQKWPKIAAHTLAVPKQNAINYSTLISRVKNEKSRNNTSKKCRKIDIRNPSQNRRAVKSDRNCPSHTSRSHTKSKIFFQH